MMRNEYNAGNTVPNLPSKTGEPSGKGRGNYPPANAPTKK